VRALQSLNAGDFVVEYVGEVIDNNELNKRLKKFKAASRHFYLMLASNVSGLDLQRNQKAEDVITNVQSLRLGNRGFA
jgi:hypothetical protein